MITVSLEAIRACAPCASSWHTLIESLPVDTTECTLAHIVESNGLNDALWALRALPLAGAKAIAAPFARGCADRARSYAAADADAARYAAARYAANAAYAAERTKQREHFLALVSGGAT